MSHEQVINKSWTTNKIDTTKSWASYEEYMNKSQTNHGGVIRKEWTIHKQAVGMSCASNKSQTRHEWTRLISIMSKPISVVVVLVVQKS